MESKITNDLATGKKKQNRKTEKMKSDNLRQNTVNYGLSETDTENRSQWLKKITHGFWFRKTSYEEKNPKKK